VANTTGDGYEESHYTITPALFVIDRGGLGGEGNCLFLKRKAELKCFMGPDQVGRDRGEEFSGHSTPSYSGRNNAKLQITEFRFYKQQQFHRLHRQISIPSSIVSTSSKFLIKHLVSLQHLNHSQIADRSGQIA
jgi:hypothetical protein